MPCDKKGTIVPQRDIPDSWVDAAMTGASPGCRDDARFYLANAYDTVREDLLWEVTRGNAWVTCACGMDWEASPDWGPDPGHGREHCESGIDATLRINGQELRIHEWRLTPLADWGGMTGRWSLTGWLREFDRTVDVYNDARLEFADLPGRTCPTGQEVSVEVTGHGDDRGLFLKVEWGREA